MFAICSSRTQYRVQRSAWYVPGMYVLSAFHLTLHILRRVCPLFFLSFNKERKVSSGTQLLFYSLSFVIFYLLFFEHPMYSPLHGGFINRANVRMGRVGAGYVKNRCATGSAPLRVIWKTDVINDTFLA